jgi:DNA modification methylase
MNRLIQGFEEVRRPDGRYVKCGICDSLERNSIVPHMKLEHHDEWVEWLEAFKQLRTKGASFKEIMWEFNRLFTWTVIKRELALSDPLLMNSVKVKDFVPIDFRLEEKTLWRFPSRGKWATHSHIYPGNWPPQVPRNLILRYSDHRDAVLDPFVGGGTTLIECMLLARNGIGVDINPRAVAITQLRLRNLRREARKQGYPIEDVHMQVRWGDARSLQFIPDETVDLVCTHPPYMDCIKYTESSFEDLSRISDLHEYAGEVRKVARELRRVLKTDGCCAIMVGDLRKNTELIPLGLKVLQTFEGEGFRIREIIVKEEERCSSDQFYRKRDDFLRIAHEYIFVFGGRV